MNRSCSWRWEFQYRHRESSGYNQSFSLWYLGPCRSLGQPMKGVCPNLRQTHDHWTTWDQKKNSRGCVWSRRKNSNFWQSHITAIAMEHHHVDSVNHQKTCHGFKSEELNYQMVRVIWKLRFPGGWGATNSVRDLIVYHSCGANGSCTVVVDALGEVFRQMCWKKTVSVKWFWGVKMIHYNKNVPEHVLGTSWNNACLLF